MPKGLSMARAAAGKPAVATGMVVAVLAAGGLLAACSTPQAAAAPAASASSGCGGSVSKLTVQGTGMATGTPDLLTVTVDINVTDPTAQAALADDNAKAASVISDLGFSGSAAKDVQTSDVTINPQYNLKGAITGYNVSNTLTAKLRNFKTAGSVIDAVAAAAGNSIRIDGLTFSVEDTRTLEDHARNDAVHQAVSHARSMALAAGERLGVVCSVSDQSQTQNFDESFGTAQRAGPGDEVALPLEPGSQQETAQVKMVYALLPPALRK
jgi:hypothetical protein